MHNILTGNLHIFTQWLGAKLFQDDMPIRMVGRFEPKSIVSLSFSHLQQNE